MGKGKKHESAAQERKNLLGINPIPDHASGSWMSKHSIASSGSNSPLHLSRKDERSPLHDWGVLQSDMKKSGRKFADIARGGKSATAQVRTATKKIFNHLDKKMSSDPKSKNYLSGEDRDFVRSQRRY